MIKVEIMYKVSMFGTDWMMTQAEYEEFRDQAKELPVYVKPEEAEVYEPVRNTTEEISIGLDLGVPGGDSTQYPDLQEVKKEPPKRRGRPPKMKEEEAKEQPKKEQNIQVIPSRDPIPPEKGKKFTPEFKEEIRKKLGLK